MEITKYLKDQNVTVIEMWECEWDALKRSVPQIRAFLEENMISLKSVFEGIKNIDEDIIIKKIQDDQFYGLVQCNIIVPKDLECYFSELPPIFKNTYVSIDDLGSHMKKYCIERKLMTQPRRTLISSFYGKEILLATPLLKWYIEHGLKIEKIQQIVEYRPQKCFKNFGDTVTQARIMGDRNQDSSILADTMKLVGNSAYGKTLENLCAHSHNKYVKDSTELVNNPLFRRQTPIDDEIMEVEIGRRHVNWNLPLQIGFFVYQYAKMKMLQFYYDCLLEYCDISDFELCEMDTDSFYIAISGNSLEDIIKPNKRRDFFKNFHRWFPAQACEFHREEFIQTKYNGKTWNPSYSCCIQHIVNEKRTPGLMKTEWIGDGCIALNSKTYFCFSYDETGCETNIKVASKGLNKKQNKFTKEKYFNVLKTKNNGFGVNIGFRTDGTKILGYEQQKESLSYLYIKRKVQDDGISTTPLTI